MLISQNLDGHAVSTALRGKLLLGHFLEANVFDPANALSMLTTFLLCTNVRYMFIDPRY